MSISFPPSPPGLRPAVVAGITLGRMAEVAGLDPAALTTSGIDGNQLSTDGAQIRVTGVTLRAQDARAGDLFAALPGSRVHGAAFARDAVEAGATSVLTDRAGLAALHAPDRAAGRSTAAAGGPAGAGGEGSHDTRLRAVPVLVVDDPRAVIGPVAAAVYGDPSRRLSVVGVTGTSGKTTTGYLLEAALSAGGHRTGLVGTVETRIAGRASKSSLTTPEAPDLQALFALMVEQQVDAAAMEVSSHALALGRVAGTHFAVGAFTNLSQDHLDFHPDMESYFQAKAMLFDGRSAAGVIAVDDEYGRRLARMHPTGITVSTAGNPDADWSVVNTGGDDREDGGGDGRNRPGGITDLGHQRFCVRCPSGTRLTVELSLPGRFNIANALVALACVDALGRDVGAAAAALREVVVPGRMERVDAGQPFLVVVDYAHKPAALTAVLRAVSAGLTGRLVVVIGAGGDRDAGKRPMMGAAAAEWADLLIVTDDNPRSEDPAAIRAAVLRGARAVQDRRRAGSVDVREIGDRREAIRAAVAAADAADAVVIAGKGHEQGQDVGGVIHPFSDRGEVTAALVALGWTSTDAGVTATGRQSTRSEARQGRP